MKNVIMNPINNVLSTINNVQSYCGNIVNTVNDSIDLIKALKKYSGLVVKALENLHIIPRSANVKGAIDKVLSYVEEKTVSTLNSITNRIDGIFGYINNMYSYLSKSIDGVTEYVENAIKSTIYQYSSFFINSLNSVYSEIQKCMNLVNNVIATITGAVDNITNSIMIEISNAIDTDKFKVSDKIVKPVLDQIMSSAFSEILSPLNSLNTVFNTVTGKINTINDFINSNIGKINEHLLWHSGR